MVTMMKSLCLASFLAVTTVRAFVPLGVRQTSHQVVATDTTHTTRRFSAVLEEEETGRKVEAAASIPWTLNTEAYGEFDQEEWGWVYSTVPPEACSSYDIQEIEGAVPTDLVGTFFRVGPGNFERNGKRYEHALDGDGFVTAFDFKGDGTVQYTGRFVETEYYQAEKEKDEVLYRNVFGTQPKEWWKNIGNVNLKNVANTNVLKWGGRLLVLWEAGRPYELDPATLEVLPPPAGDGDSSDWGPYKNLGKPYPSFRGVTIDEGGPLDTKLNFARSFTAHPHIIGTGDDQRLVGIKTAMNVKTESVQLEIVTFDKEWRECSSIPYTLPGAPAAPHDFSISENYYCLVQNRLGLDNIPFLLGLKSPTQVLQLAIKEPTTLHVVSKTAGKKSLQFELPPYFNLHNVPMAEETANGKLILHTNGWDLKDERFFPADKDTAPFLGSWGGRYPDFRFVPPSHLYRTVVDLESEELISHEQVVPGLVMEFPTEDEDGLVYISVADTDNISLPGTGLGQLDLNDPKKIQYWYAEPKIFTGELIPIRKRNGDKGSWLLTMLYDFTNKRATLAILDSERFAEGPVTRIHLKHPLAYGLHGSFAER